MDKRGAANVEVQQPTEFDYLKRILIELKLINYVLVNGLNVKDDIDVLRRTGQFDDTMNF